jgi:uroporphyrinogen-III decarboxylase
MTNKTLLTGLDLTTLEQSTPTEVAAQAREVIEQTGGSRLILAPACVIPPKTPLENLQAIVALDRSVG